MKRRGERSRHRGHKSPFLYRDGASGSRNPVRTRAAVLSSLSKQVDSAMADVSDPESEAEGDDFLIFEYD